MRILNLTQHTATCEQVAAGVVDLSEADRKYLVKELTFDALPTKDDIRRRAENLGLIPGQHGFSAAMIGGAPYLMAPLEKVLRREGVEALYAFSTRVSVDAVKPDGSVTKTAVFRHTGFIPA